MRLSVQLQAHKLPMSHLVLVYDGYDAIPWFRIHFKMGLEYQPYKWPREKYSISCIFPTIQRYDIRALLQYQYTTTSTCCQAWKTGTRETTSAHTIHRGSNQQRGSSEFDTPYTPYSIVVLVTILLCNYTLTSEQELP